MPDAPDAWDDGLPPGGMVCSVCGQPTESEPCAEHQIGTVADVWLDMLDELSESPLPGARYAYRVVAGRRAAIKAALGATVAAAVRVALSSPETTPAPDAGLDVERLARAMAEDDDIDEQQWIEWGKGSFRDWARDIAAEYAALGRSGSGGGRG